jgi:hypothetical protein
MKNYALLDENNFVINISIADQNWDSSGWVEYSNSNPAIIGGDYYEGFFYPPQPFDSWTRNNGHWEAPTPKPETEGFWIWNEESGEWHDAFVS